jgi:hypothetical protein
MSYDPRDQILVVANNAATPPYITMISTRPDDRRVLGHVIYSDAAGVEQSVYNPVTGLFYVNLTQVGPDPNNGAVSIVDPRQLEHLQAGWNRIWASGATAWCDSHRSQVRTGRLGCFRGGVGRPIRSTCVSGCWRPTT